MAFKKINTSEQYLNDRFFKYAIERGGKYFLQTDKGEVEINTAFYDTLENAPKVDSKRLANLDLIGKVFKKADGQGGGPAVGTALETGVEYVAGDSEHPVYFNINYDTATLKAWCQSKKDAGLFNEEGQLGLGYIGEESDPDKYAYLSIGDLEMLTGTPGFGIIMNSGGIVWLSDDIDMPEDEFHVDGGWLAGRGFDGDPAIDINGKWVAQDEGEYYTVKFDSFNSSVSSDEWNGLWISETEFAGGSVSYKHYAELNNKEIVDIDKDTYDAIVAHTDEYSEYEFYALNDVYYNKDYINRVQNGVAELVNGDKIALKDAEKSAISGEGSAFRAIGEGEGGGASGTPFVQDDEISKLYFNTSMSDEEISTIIRETLDGEDAATAIIFDDDQMSDPRAIQFAAFDGTYFIIRGEDLAFIYASDDFEMEEVVVTKGWHELTQGEYAFPNEVTVDLTIDGEPIPNVDKWNGILISKTAFEGSGTGTSDYFNINKMVKVLDSNGKKYLELKKGIRIEIPESVYSTLKTGAIEINEVAYIANNPIVSGFKSGNDYYVVFNTGIQLKISATDSASAKEIFEAIFVKANGYYTVNGTFYLDKEIFKVFSPKANVYVAEFKNGMQSGVSHGEYNTFTDKADLSVSVSGSNIVFTIKRNGVEIEPGEDGKYAIDNQDTVEISAVAEDGYELKSLKVDGVEKISEQPITLVATNDISVVGAATSTYIYEKDGDTLTLTSALYTKSGNTLTI